MKRVLILCTGNSCRSQMAEGWVRGRLSSRWVARSAGTQPAERVHPLALRAMAEVGIDLADARPRPVDALLGDAWDLVVTVRDSARDACPRFPGAVPQIHVSFDDPASAQGTDAERMAVFRRVRDEIRERPIPELERRGPR